TGMFVGTSANVNQATGIFCGLSVNIGGPDTVDIIKVVNGAQSGLPISQSLGSPVMMTAYRLRLTQRGGMWTCEALVGSTPITVSTTLTATAPLYITLRNDNMGSNFHSVVAESKLP
ncbi:MAG TPA: hypothetical protein VF997_16335, partial [Polyangia bacterium]